MIIKSGDKVHIITRRLFDNDLRRHFAGEVIEVDENAIRASGYVFVMEAASRYVRRPDRRTRIFSLTDGENIFNVIPSGTDLEKLTYGPSQQGRLVVTDGADMELDINEFGPVL